MPGHKGKDNSLPPCELGAEAARESLRARLEVLRQHIEPLRAGSVSGVHDMRVASRRLRAALKEFKPLLGKSARKPFERQVRSITRALGRPRELDVMARILQEWKDLLPDAQETMGGLLDEINRRRKGSDSLCETALALVEAPEFAEQSENLLQSVHPQVKCHLARMREGLAEQLEAAGGAYDRWICKSGNERLHQLRICCKKLRYACEIHAQHYPEVMPGFLTHLKGVQDCLGRWNDVRMLHEELIRVRDEDAGAWPDGGDYFLEALEEDEQDKRSECEITATDFFAPDTREAARYFLLAPESTCCQSD